MKNILGLDLGTNSIGWALIEIDENGKPIKIISLGSRIIPISSDDRDQFTKGQTISKNQDRTLARTQRKGYDRKQLRKSNDFKYSLKRLLEKYDIYPTTELIKLPMLDLWKLRNDAASEPITAEQLGRILYMLNQKRGYKSARSEANQDKKDTEYVAEIKGRYSQLKANNQTIGQYFYNELKAANENSSYFRIKERVYPREAYEEEFDTIINTQKNTHPFLNENVINELRNEIIYYQRKLKSQKGLVSVCEFEGFEKVVINKKKKQEKTLFVGPKVAPRTSPLFQLCKIWETVNNINLKIKNPEGAKYKWTDRIITLEEKQRITDYLFKHPNLSFNDLLNILNLSKDEVYANKQLLRGLQGNNTYSDIHNILNNSELLKFDVSIIPSKHLSILVDKKTGEILEEKEPMQIDAILEKEPFYQLWHTIYSIKELKECQNALKKRFGFDDEIAEKLSHLDFNKQGFGNKSNKAMRKILPYLMFGYNYADACSFAGYNHSNSLTKEEQAQMVTIDKLELLPKNTLRQPVVEKILNQMINVVNGIIEKYGKPYEIRVELARELKQSKDERNDATLHNSANEVINKEIENRLNEHGIKTTKRYIDKYKLLFPIRTVIDGKTGRVLPKKLKDAIVTNQCIYCGQSFSLTEALTGENFDVDHIVPKDLLPIDNSLTNKVLVHRHCNSTKTNQTAYDFIAKKGEKELSNYIDRVDKWYKQGIISFSKMQRLKVSYEEYLERRKHKKETEADKKLWENFLDRDLRATQYISRKSREILQQACNNVTATEGTVTAILRKLWGWEDVLMNLQMPKYKELGQTVIREWESDHGRIKHKKEEIENWTKRDDHRHHAIDALVIACTQQGFIQRINTLNASDVKDAMRKEIELAKKDYKERLTLLDKYLIEQKPFTTFEVENEADKILVSFKSGKKVATISKYKATGKNEKTGVIVPRGALHEQSVYGKIKLNGVENTVLKYKLQNLKLNQIEDIVDKRIRELVQDRLKQCNNNLKEAFKNILWFDEKKQIPILTVRIFARPDADKLVPIKKDENGLDIGFVLTGNNHHIAIYTDIDNNYIEHPCTFWNAVERKKNKIPVIIKNSNEVLDLFQLNMDSYPEGFIKQLPQAHLNLKLSMQQNEMFVLGMSDEEFQTALSDNNKPLISKHLYLVWSISHSDYWFRHHVETKNTELKNIAGAKESKRYYRFKSVKSLMEKNPIKVRINHLGEITKTGEY